jgi:uncharacterized membrane protein YdbT with pleckstrin-like domain
MTINPKSQLNDLVLWIGKPLFKPYLVTQIIAYKWTIIILLLGIGIPLIGTTLDGSLFNWENTIAFICIVTAIGIGQILLKIIGFKNRKYWITKEAVYIQSGVIRSSVRVIEKSKMVFIDVKKNKFDRKYNTGTIVIDCGETKRRDNEEYKIYQRLEAIQNPEEVLRFF